MKCYLNSIRLCDIISHNSFNQSNKNYVLIISFVTDEAYSILR